MTGEGRSTSRSEGAEAWCERTEHDLTCPPSCQHPDALTTVERVKVRRRLWMRGPRWLWVCTHDWKYDDQGRPYDGSLTRFALWVLR